MTDHRSRRRNGRDGFTLIEVVIVVALMGVLAVAIAGVFTVIVRTTPSTEARADDARSLLGISTWLPSDVGAIPRTPLAPLSGLTIHWDNTPGRSSGCSGTDPGTNLLRLQHRESITGAPQNFFVSYRLVDDAESSRIVRVTCANDKIPAINNVSAGLPLSSQNPVTVTWKTATDLGVEYVIGVEMEITTFEGDTLRVDASSRNPDQTLSTIPDAVTTTIDPNTTTTTAAATTTSTTTTTTTTTTPVSTTTTGPSVPPPPNQPPIANPVSGTVAPGSMLNIALPVSDPNGDALAVTLIGVPNGWIVTPPAGTVTTTVQITPPANETNKTYVINYTVTDPSGASASSTINVEVSRIPCTASVASIDPNPVRNTANGNGNGNGNGNQVGPLEQAVTVTVNKSGNCSELVLRYTRVASANGNQASDDDLTSQINLFGDSITVTFPAIPTQRWQKGERRIELVEFAGQLNEIIHQTRQLKVD